MVDLDILAAKGVTAEKLKAIFAPEGGQLSENANRIMNRVRARIQDGRQRNYTDANLFYAIDRLVETPFRQASLALIQGLSDFKDEKNTDKIAKDFGLTHLLFDEMDPKTKKPTGKKVLNVPALFEIAIPLAGAMAQIRAARLTNDRMQVPLFKYAPQFSTPDDVRRGEVITSRVEIASDQLGYRNTMRQVILKTCQYGRQLKFIQEEWWTEKQYKGTQPEPQIIREGLRYRLPHPSWTYYDLDYPASTINTNSGMRFCGHWMIRKYGDLCDDPLLWNTTRIKMGAEDWRSQNVSFYATALNGCTLAPPCTFAAYKTLITQENITPFFNSTLADAGVFLNHHFEKMNPKTEGIGDYDGEVWFRFLVANDCTPLWVAPLPAPPATYWGYDSDDSRMYDASVVQQAAPYEFWVGNLLTQQLLSIKANLANLTFYNEDFVTQEVVDALQNHGEKYYRRPNFFPLSGKYLQRLRSGSASMEDSFYSAKFPKSDTNTIPATISMVLTLMERLLGISAQESGTQGSHQQSAEEMRVITSSTGTRVEYTNLGIDDGVTAWKRQLYDYMMAYGSESFYGYVTAEGTTEADLTRLGFTVVATGDDKIKVKGNKTAIELDLFSSVRDGKDRVNPIEIGQQMVQLLAPFAPKLAMAMPPGDIAKMFNGVLNMFDLPRDWRIPTNLEDQGALASEEWVVQQITGLGQKISQMIGQTNEQMMQNVLGASQKLAQDIAGLGQATGQIAERQQQQEVQIAGLAKILQTAQAIADDTSPVGSPTTDPNAMPVPAVAGP